MKLNNALLTTFTIILICACNKNKDFNLPELSCSTPSKDIQFVKSSILGEWKLVEYEGGFEASESTFIFTDSINATRINKSNDTNSEFEITYNYTIELGVNCESNEFIINLNYLRPSRNSIKFCQDEFVMFNEEMNFWERYERN